MKEIKNKLYELEGLLELADMRPEKLSTLKPLIDKRLDEILALWRNMPEESAPKQAPESAPKQAPESAPKQAQEPALKQAQESPELVEESEEEDAPLYLRLDESEESERKKDSEEIDGDESDKRYKSDTSVTLKMPDKTALPAEKKIALCLNDRFRFTKVLGLGNKAEFERRLSRLANAGDFETARDYIVDECNLDPDDADVADLLEIVKTYYD